MDPHRFQSTTSIFESVIGAEFCVDDHDGCVQGCGCLVPDKRCRFSGQQTRVENHKVIVFGQSLYESGHACPLALKHAHRLRFGQRKDRNVLFDRRDRSFVHRQTVGDALMPRIGRIDLKLIDKARVLQIGIDQSDLKAGLGSRPGKVHRNGRSTDTSFSTGDC